MFRTVWDVTRESVKSSTWHLPTNEMKFHRADRATFSSNSLILLRSSLAVKNLAAGTRPSQVTPQPRRLVSVKCVVSGSSHIFFQTYGLVPRRAHHCKSHIAACEKRRSRCLVGRGFGEGSRRRCFVSRARLVGICGIWS